MQHVMIIGGPGSGKSTLARVMGKRTGLPVHHMDRIHWKPGWVERTRAEKRPLVLDVLAGKAWILEGNHRGTREERAASADTVIWLDLPVGLRFRRVVWRTLRDYGKTRTDMAPDCPEAFHSGTLPFWRYIWTTRQTCRQYPASLAANPRHLTVYHLKTRSQVAAFIANLPANAGAPK